MREWWSVGRVLKDGSYFYISTRQQVKEGKGLIQGHSAHGKQILS